MSLSGVKYVGTKVLIDPKTGEEIELTVIQKKFDLVDSKSWRRVVMADLMDAIERIGNKKIKVLEFLVDNMDKENFIRLPQREIQRRTGISIETISETFKTLMECGLLTKLYGGYALNCSIVSAYGDKRKNSALMIRYEQEDYVVNKKYNTEVELKRAELRVAKLKKELENKKIKKEEEMKSVS